MLKSIKQKLNILYQNALQEFSQTPIATSVVVFGAIATLPLVSLIVWLRDSFLYPLSPIIEMTIELRLSLIVWSLCLLSISVYLVHKKFVLPKKEFSFIEAYDFAWKIINPKMPNFEVDFPSYCKNHHVQHIQADSYYICPVCSNTLTTELDFAKMSMLHEAVEKIIKAKFDKHLKNGNPYCRQKNI